MKRIYVAFLVVLAASLIGCDITSDVEYHVIPEPRNMELSADDVVKISSVQYDVSDTMLRNLATLFTDRMQMPLDGAGNVVTLSVNDSVVGAEAYSINATEKGVEVVGGDYAGVFYGLLTLKQLNNKGAVPIGTVNDSPRFSWRGGMLDVARHFQPVENVKQYIDILAYHKLNKFHWHLTDGIGWRIEIEKYPELTRRGAWRLEKYPEAPWVGLTLATKDSLGAVGGFYTKAQIREVVDYAKSRFIEVIPEIEMPGHSEAATICYPEYSCVNAMAGSGVYCTGKEATFEYLFDILDEVGELFPSQYIHIGGDEVGKGQWSVCPDCKKRMKSEKLKDEHELQSYFVKRISNHLKSRGKVMIGWDEISQGGLADEAVVMSWTGWENGINAAHNKHNVVMCPIDYVYIDHYQAYNDGEPQGWGGLNNLKRVYEFPVIPQGLEKEYQKYVLGGQANLWTENISEWSHAQYMLLPRFAALSEALWSVPENRSWDNFAKKMVDQFERYRSRGWNYSQSAYTPTVESLAVGSEGNITIKLARELSGFPIYYTLDGTEPSTDAQQYDTVIVIDSHSTLRAATFDDEQQIGRQLVLDNLHNLASGRKVHYATKYGADYSGGGDGGLTDSRVAVKRGDDKGWQGFEGQDMNVTVDLGDVHDIANVDLRFFQHKGSTSVMLPSEVTVEVSTDGKNYQKFATQLVPQIENFDAVTVPVSVKMPAQQGRYVRIVAKNQGVLPPTHPRAGAKAWIFTDEIAVY